MRKTLFALLLLLLPVAAFAQDDSWRNRPADRGRYDRYDRRGDNYFEIMPFLGYRYGGTIYADRSSLFNRNVDVASNANYGVTFGIPLAPNGMKLELMANRQDTHFTSNNDSLFQPNQRLGDFHITYYHAGLLIPFEESRAVTPFVVVSAGIANLDPNIPGVSTVSSNRFSASAGVGAKVPLNRNLAFRVEARGYFTTMGSHNTCSTCYYYNDYNHDLYQGETNVGLDFRF